MAKESNFSVLNLKTEFENSPAETINSKVLQFLIFMLDKEVFIFISRSLA